MYKLLMLLTLLCFNAQADQLKVGVVDTGLDMTNEAVKPFLCPSGHKDFTGKGFEDNMLHGSEVVSIILNTATTNNYCLLIIKYYDSEADSPTHVMKEVLSFDYAIQQGAKIINFSSSGLGFFKEEYELIKSHPEVVFVVAAGNNHYNLDNPNTQVYPASYDLPNIQVVGSLDRWGKEKLPSSNYGSIVKYWEIGEYQFGSGTSFAAPVHTGRLINEAHQ